MTPGKISCAVYEWAKQEMERLPVGTDVWAEYSAITGLSNPVLRRVLDYVQLPM